jgi:LacI family transcriptional regulator
MTKTDKITIADIAAKAGVSKATVSRVLNNRPEGVGAALRARIQDILGATGFQPSGVARGLATGRSRSVGLIIPDITNPFYPLLVRGVEAALSESGYSLFLCNSADDIVKEKDYVRVLMEKGVDGVILDSVESECDCQLELLEAKGVPFVLLDRLIEGRSTQVGVFVDNRQGARLAASHLFSRPDCALVFLKGPVERSQSILRLAGVEDVWREKGLPAAALRVLNGDDSIESGYRLTAQLLDQAKTARGAGSLPFNAIFACNDLMAVGALRALKERGVAIPAQVEVIGFDDIELADLVDPPLSTVSQPALEMGARSAELLLQLIDGQMPRPETVVLMPKLVLRGTTRASCEATA